MRRFILLGLLMIFVLPVNIYADENGTKVIDMRMCTGIADREPVGESDNFSNSLERIYCYTKVKTDNPPDYITHVWIYNNKTMANIKLNIKGNTWRTWSSKGIVHTWSGKWKVRAIDSNGELLMERDFALGSVLDDEEGY